MIDLEEVYALDEDAALQWGIDTFEGLLSDGQFQEVDTLLDRFDPTRCASVVSLGILSITFWGKKELKRRDAFLEKAEPHMRKEWGDVRAESLLHRRR